MWSYQSYQKYLSEMDIEHPGIKPFTFRRLIWIFSAVFYYYYWDTNPFGRAVMWVLHYVFVLSMIFNVFILSCPFFVFFFLFSKRTKTWQNLCLSMSFANYADCFTLRFVFNVRLMILWYIYIFENKYIYTFNFNNLLKMNTFNVILG